MLSSRRQAPSPVRREAAFQVGDLLGGREVTFVVADPPRRSCFAVWDLRGAEISWDSGGSRSAGSRRVASNGEDLPDVLDVVLPSGNGVRRRRVPARFVAVADAIVALRDAGMITHSGPGHMGDVATAPGSATADFDAGSQFDATAGSATAPDFDMSTDFDTEPALRARPAPSASVLAWSAAVTAGLVVLARGRLYPGVSHAGYDIWRAGPLDPADLRLLAALAEAMPPTAYATVHDSRSPMRVPSPDRLVAAAWDALADTLPRTASALAVTGTPLFSVIEPQAAEHLRPWLVDAAQGLGGGALVALRVELTAEEPPTSRYVDDGVDDDDVDDDDFDEDDEAFAENTADADAIEDAGNVPAEDLAEDIADHDAGNAPAAERSAVAGNAGAVTELGAADEPLDAGMDDQQHVAAGRAVLELTSRVEPSLVVDAADLFAGPAAVLARFGADTETDLLLALRRGARVWPPLGELLRERAPTAVTLDEERLGDLLGEIPTELAAAGIEVRWPTDLVTDGLALRAVIVEQPGKVTEAGFSLDELVEFRWEATLGGDALSPEEIDVLAEAKRGLVRMRGRWVTVDPHLLDQLRRRRARRLRAAEALGALLAGTVDVDGELVAVVAPGRLGQVAEVLRQASGADAELLDPPDGLRVELRPYQHRGVSWLWAMASTGIGGCLADDMGLGKTVQVIALHLHRQAAGSGPSLVVCPTTLLTNWEREVRRFAPDVAVRRFHGSGRSLADLVPGELVVTSYGVARTSTDELASAGFSLVVADEAQHAKNPTSATARALRAIPAQARIALTGTPVENRLSELWAILDWTTPGLLGPLERFLHSVAVPVERYHDPVVTERLARTVRPFLLRRRKTDPGIAPDLPPRTVSDVPVPLTAEQVTLYEAEVREAMAKIRAKAGFERQGLVLRLLTVLKQICNHPAQYLHQRGPVPGRSGKFAALEELLGVIVAEGESTLVFSQFVECLALVDTRLGELGVRNAFLHGQVPARRRAAMVDAFQAGEVPVFLISLKSGGVGLNLTRATHVIHVDRWWNPAVEDQATDRAHRIGQDRPVQVHRLVAEGTLEDRIAEVIEAKRSLAESVVGSGEAWVSSLSDDDLAALVELGRA